MKPITLPTNEEVYTAIRTLFGIDIQRESVEVLEKLADPLMVLERPAAFTLTDAQREKIYAFRELMKYVGLQSNRQPYQFRSPDDVGDFLNSIIGYDKYQEHFAVLYLNTKNHLIEASIETSGTENTTLIPSRHIARKAITLGAVNVIVGHNHPSGVLTPSQEDIHVTYGLHLMLKAVQIDLIDHVIVSNGEHVSLTKNGYMDFTESSYDELNRNLDHIAENIVSWCEEDHER